VSGPLVSVIVPTRNRPEQLDAALESVTGQTYPHLEAIVVDDASTPPARPATRDLRVSVTRLAAARGVAHARNEGLRRARGGLICFLDDDDAFLSEKLAVQVAFLEAHPDVELVFSQVAVLNPDGSEAFCLPDDHRHDAVENLRLFNAIHTNGVLFRQAVAERVRFDERLTRFTDTQFFAAAAFCCSVRYLPRRVAIWNRHVSSDHVTRPDLAAELRNFKLLRGIFADELSRHPDVRREYDRILDTLELRLLKRSFAPGR